MYENLRYTVTEDKHTQTGEPIWVLNLIDELPKDQWKKFFNTLKAAMNQYVKYWAKKGIIFYKYDPSEELEQFFKGGKKVTVNKDPNAVDLQDIYDYIDKVNQAEVERFKQWGFTMDPPKIELQVAKKYYKLWKKDKSSNSIFAFIDKSGNIYKPASTNAPAKGVRGNVKDQYVPLSSGDLFADKTSAIAEKNKESKEPVTEETPIEKLEKLKDQRYKHFEESKNKTEREERYALYQETAEKLAQFKAVSKNQQNEMEKIKGWEKEHDGLKLELVTKDGKRAVYSEDAADFYIYYNGDMNERNADEGYAVEVAIEEIFDDKDWQWISEDMEYNYNEWLKEAEETMEELGMKNPTPDPIPTNEQKNSFENKPFNDSIKPKNLSQFKEWLKNNVGNMLYMIRVHNPNSESIAQIRLAMVESRIINTVQTNSVGTLTEEGKESWIEYGQAKDWTFTDQYAVVNQGWVALVYFYNKHTSNEYADLVFQAIGRADEVAIVEEKKENLLELVEKPIIGQHYYDKRKGKTFKVSIINGENIGLDYINKNNQIEPTVYVNQNEWDYYTNADQWSKYKQPYIEEIKKSDLKDLQPSDDIVEYLKNHTKSEAYRLNNMHLSSNFISRDQHLINHNWITNQPNQKSNNVDDMKSKLFGGKTNPYSAEIETINQLQANIIYAKPEEKEMYLVQLITAIDELKNKSTDGFPKKWIDNIDNTLNSAQSVIDMNQNKLESSENITEKIKEAAKKMAEWSEFRYNDNPEMWEPPTRLVTFRLWLENNGYKLLSKKYAEEVKEEYYNIQSKAKEEILNDPMLESMTDPIDPETSEMANQFAKAINNASSKNFVENDYKNPHELNQGIRQFVEAFPNSENWSKEELEFVARYSGSGGLEKFGADDAGMLTEYFTPDVLVRKMWALAIQYGFKGGMIMEPSVGTGNFLKYVNFTNSDVVAYEMNPVSAKIVKALFPAAEIINNSFASHFYGKTRVTQFMPDPKFKNNFDLVIGNPPYGDMKWEKFKSQEESLLKVKGMKYEHYFMLRGLDCLKKGGLLLYVTTNNFFTKGYESAKEAITKRADLIDAYLLPNGTFKRTTIGTAIIVLRKK